MAQNIHLESLIIEGFIAIISEKLADKVNLISVDYMSRDELSKTLADKLREIIRD